MPAVPIQVSVASESLDEFHDRRRHVLHLLLLMHQLLPLLLKLLLVPQLIELVPFLLLFYLSVPQDLLSLLPQLFFQNFVNDLLSFFQWEIFSFQSLYLQHVDLHAPRQI